MSAARSIDRDVVDALPPEERHEKILSLLRDALDDDHQWLVAAVDRTTWDLVSDTGEQWGLPIVRELVGSQPPHVVTLLETYGLQTDRLGFA